MSRSGRSPLVGLVALLVAGAAGPAAATPRYALEVGQKCNLCHHNPTGGGQRDPYASQYLLPTRLAMQLGSETEPSGPNPQIGDDVVLGADLRTFWLKRSDTDTRNNFVEMQGSVYVKFQLDPRFSAYVHQEFGALGKAEAFEIYGMGYVLPGNGYVKVGKFVPAFGWKIPDHRSFTRREFVFLPRVPPHADTGVELGTHPGPFVLNAAVVNGAAQSPFDDNDDVAFVGRGSVRGHHGPVNGVLGGSYYYNSGTSEDRQAGGPFAGLHWGPVTWIGELDWTRREAVPAGTVVNAFTTMHEVSVRVVQGAYLVGTYDFHDADIDVASGAVHRIGGGVDVLPWPFLALRSVFHAYVVDEGAGIAAGGFSGDFNEGHLQVQFLY